MKVSCKNATINITITDIKLEKVKKKKNILHEYRECLYLCRKTGSQFLRQ